MQNFNTPKTGERASVSRRNFLSIAAAGSAATLPAVALAEASGKTDRLPQLPELSLDEQFDSCVSNLKRVLALMCPDAVDLEAETYVKADSKFGIFYIIKSDQKVKT